MTFHIVSHFGETKLYGPGRRREEKKRKKKEKKKKVQ